MHLEAHAGVGWILALAAKGDRRLRAAVTAAAVLPDLDTAAYLFGPTAYITYHHVLSHNILFSLLVSGAAVYFCRQYRLRAFVFTQLAFYSHYLGDYLLTIYPLKFFYPFSDAAFSFSGALPLWHPLNTALLYVGIALMILPAFVIKRTPLEILSPGLDARIVNMFFIRRRLECHLCGRACNETCESCGKPVCLRHAVLARGFKLLCRNCPPEKTAP